ncbi:methionine--tRNA ligase [Psychrobacillus sp. FSL K6-4046]|uniref:methionine--tRNA ligase n=1 Tax=Psychrobacillus sp. FSL K6-4046 TaxID=2921550 RepID=UPI00261530C5|nr:methionine--tRNA ligase [uncultured Psychrobacillus sp.]
MAKKLNEEKGRIKMNIFIGGAWPYANGSLHLGHIAALLPGDILARYYRQKGEEVLYVSGSDCNGTPISIRANSEGVTTKEIADRYHNEFKETFNRLGFSYDMYTRTDSDHHHKVVRQIFLELWKNGYIYEKEIEQIYCESDNQFLPDRYVEGSCPNCGSRARGDQCDACSLILDPMDLTNRSCKLCGNEPTVKATKHLYFQLSSFQEQLENYLTSAKANHAWRENAVHLTERYLNEGLRDRAASRDLPNGVSIPIEGYEEKKVYVWIEAVSGYYSASKEWATLNQTDEKEFWNEQTISYYVHGKDNIPFHTVIWPAILKGIRQETLPTHIISNEYLTLEKRKFSTSQKWAVWAPYFVEKYHPDSLRYFLTSNAPENRDSDFSWREFIHSHNGELLGAYGNFINRTLKFIEKSFEGTIPDRAINTEIEESTLNLYSVVGQLIEGGHFKLAIDSIFSYIREANRFFDVQKPWIQVKEDRESCLDTLASCVYIIGNVAQLLSPFLPFSSEEVRKILKLEEFHWKPIKVKVDNISNIQPLFARIDPSTIQEEIDYLEKQLKNVYDKGLG